MFTLIKSFCEKIIKLKLIKSYWGNLAEDFTI